MFCGGARHGASRVKQDELAAGSFNTPPVVVVVGAVACRPNASTTLESIVVIAGTTAAPPIVEVEHAAEGGVRVSMSDVALPGRVDSSPDILHEHTSVGISARESPRRSCHGTEQRVKGNVRIA